MKLIITIFMVSTFFSCQKLNQLTADQIYNQYAFLLKEGMEYDAQNPKFKYEIQDFINSYEEVNAATDKIINPFIGTNSRLKPIILSPYFFNNEKDKVIIMILIRGRSMSGKPVDRVKLVLGDKSDSKWSFRREKVESTNYRYGNNYPIISDTFISLSMVNKFINRKYMYRNKLEINDSFFDEFW
jgi:hypothetical protein